MSRLSLESIAYQGDSNRLINGLNTLFTDALEEYANGNLNRVVDILEELGHHVKSVTGVNMTFSTREPSLFAKVFANSYTAGVVIPTGLKNLNVVNQRTFKQFSEGTLKVVNTEELLDGHIDFKKGTVSGFYSTLLFEVKFSTVMFDGALSADSLTGITLHELAHAWDYLVNLGIGTVTTALAAGISDFFDRYDNPDKRLRMVSAVISKDIPLPKDELSKEMAVSMVIGDTPARVRQWIGVEYKSGETNEYLADMFATRWGGGVSIAKALRDLYDLNRVTRHLGTPSRWNGAIGTGISVMLSPIVGNTNRLIQKGGLGISALTNTLAKAVMIEILVSLLVDLIVSSLNPYGRHPTIQKRVEYIRSDLIGILREVKRPADRLRLLEDLQVIDDIADDVKNWRDRWRDFFRTIGHTVTDRGRTDRFNASLAERNNNRLYELLARIEAAK